MVFKMLVMLISLILNLHRWLVVSVKLSHHHISPTTVNRPVWVTSFLGLSPCWLNLSLCMCVRARAVCAAAHACAVEKEARREIQEILGSGPISWKDMCFLCVWCVYRALYVLVAFSPGLEERPCREKLALAQSFAQRISHYTAYALWVELALV